MLARMHNWSDNRLKGGRKDGRKGGFRGNGVEESKLRDRIDS